MDEQEGRMDRRTDEPGKLILRWKVSSFLPLLEEEQPPRILEETLYSKDFRSEADIRGYWSVPERLVDLRWAAERQGMDGVLRPGSRGAEFDGYFAMEYDLYRIVTTIGEWGGACGKSVEAINDSRDSLSALEELRRREEPFLRECALQQERPSGFSNEELRRLFRITEELLALDVPDSRRGGLRGTVKSFRTSYRQAFREGEEAYESSLYPPEQMQPLYRLAAEFSRRLLDFMENPTWRESQGAALKLQELVKAVRKIQPDWSPAGEDFRSAAYQQSLWEGLQSSADAVCGVINDTGPSGSFTAEALLQRVSRAVDLLGLSKRQETKLWKDYTKDTGRCVALLDVSGGGRTMAFSGYFDCEDNQAHSLLSCVTSEKTTELIDAFRAVCRCLRADLAVLSAGVVDRMRRSELDNRFQIRLSGPLRAEMAAGAGVPFLKKSYSCCERKILAELEPRNYTDTSASLYVKFQPCFSCYGVLREWMNANRIGLTLDVLKQ